MAPWWALNATYDSWTTYKAHIQHRTEQQNQLSTANWILKFTPNLTANSTTALYRYWQRIRLRITCVSIYKLTSNWRFIWCLIETILSSNIDIMTVETPYSDQSYSMVFYGLLSRSNTCTNRPWPWLWSWNSFSSKYVFSFFCSFPSSKCLLCFSFDFVRYYWSWSSI